MGDEPPAIRSYLNRAAVTVAKVNVDAAVPLTDAAGTILARRRPGSAVEGSPDPAQLATAVVCILKEDVEASA